MGTYLITSPSQEDAMIDSPDVDEPLLHECLAVLDAWQAGGRPAMCMSGPCLREQFHQLTKSQARQVVAFWMITWAVVDREKDQRAR